MGIAASAVAVAASVLAPSAQAAPMVPVPNAPLTGITSPALAPATLGLGNLATDLFFFGTAPNPNNHSPSTTILAIKPITLLPGALQPLFGWFSSLNLDVCIAGVGLHIGAYGTVSATIARTC